VTRHRPKNCRLITSVMMRWPKSGWPTLCDS